MHFGSPLMIELLVLVTHALDTSTATGSTESMCCIKFIVNCREDSV